MDGESTSSPGSEAAVSSERLAERVKALRRETGLTLEALAARAGVSRAMLSKVERGEKNPTLIVAARIAGGLGVTLTQLIDAREGGAVVVTPRGERRVMRDPETGFERQEVLPNLTPPPGGRGVDLMYDVVPEGSTSGELPPLRKGAEARLVVERGRLRAVIGGSGHTLEAGDAACFEADAPHRFDNAGAGECGYYLVVYHPGA